MDVLGTQYKIHCNDIPTSYSAILQAKPKLK